MITIDTLSHGVWAFLLFRNRKGLLLFILGSIFMDLPYLIGSVYHFFFKPGFGIPAYYDMLKIPAVKYAGHFFHSIIIWGVTFFLIYIIKRQWLPFMWGWLLHLSIDALTHHSDSLPFFWPISQKVYPGLISYWEPKYYGIEFMLVDLTFLVAVLLILFWQPNKSKK